MHGSVSTVISGGVGISEVPGCHLLQQMSSRWESQKSLERLVSRELTSYLFVFDLFLTHEMVILLKGHKPDNFESQVTLVGVSFIILIDYIIFFNHS